MLYYITFDIKDATRIENFTRQLSEIGEYISVLPRCYFLKTKTTLDRNEIYKKLKAVLFDEDLFLITETELQSMSGWLSSSAVEWLKDV